MPKSGITDGPSLFYVVANPLLRSIIIHGSSNQYVIDVETIMVCGIPCNITSIVCWKIAGADAIPKRHPYVSVESTMSINGNRILAGKLIPGSH